MVVGAVVFCIIYYGFCAIPSPTPRDLEVEATPWDVEVDVSLLMEAVGIPVSNVLSDIYSDGYLDCISRHYSRVSQKWQHTSVSLI